jgi:hypothetical protein
MNLDNSVEETAREAAELTGTDNDTLAFDLDNERSAQHNEALVAFLVGVGPGIDPGLGRVVVPDLQQIRLESNTVGTLAPGQQGGVVRQLSVVKALESQGAKTMLVNTLATRLSKPRSRGDPSVSFGPSILANWSASPSRRYTRR